MACRGNQTTSIRFLGGVGLAGGAVRQQHEQVLKSLAAAPNHVRDVGRAAQAKQQFASSASTIERAAGDVERAATHRDITTAITSAQRALDQARRSGADRKELVALERKVESLEREGLAKGESLMAAETAAGQQFAMRADPLSRSMLGVPANRVATPRDGHRQGQPVTAAPPESVRVLRAELDALRSGDGDRKELGDFSEAVVAGLATLVRDHSILQQHNPGDSPHGLDIHSLDTTGKVWAFEVKGTRVAGSRAIGTHYAVGRQGSAEYVADRSRSSPVSADSAVQVGIDDDQVGSLLVQVNVTDDEVTIWELDSDGTRGAVPLEVYRLDDVVHIVDES